MIGDRILYGVVVCLGSVREILGAGTLSFGFSLFGSNFQPWVLFLLPSGGFFTLASWLLIFAWWKEQGKEKEARMRAVSLGFIFIDSLLINNFRSQCVSWHLSVYRRIQQVFDGVAHGCIGDIRDRGIKRFGLRNKSV